MMHIKNAIYISLTAASFSWSNITVEMVEVGQIGKPSMVVSVEFQRDFCDLGKFEKALLKIAHTIRGDLPPNLTYLEGITKAPEDGEFIRVDIIKDTTCVEVERGVFGLSFFYCECVIKLRDEDNLGPGAYSFNKLRRLDGLQIKLGEFWMDYNKKNWDFNQKRIDPANYFKKKATLIELDMNNVEGEEILFRCTTQILGITLYKEGSLVSWIEFPYHIKDRVIQYLSEIGVSKP